MHIFTYDNAIMRGITKFGYLWLLSVLWLVLCIPVVTAGAATTALLYTCMKLTENEGYPLKNFFHSFKLNFKQATGIEMIYLAVGALIYIGAKFYSNYNNDISWVATAILFAVLIPYVASLLYVFAIQAKFYNPVKMTIRYAHAMACRNFMETLMMLAIMAGVVLANMAGYKVINFFFMNFGAGIVGYLLAFHYNRIFDQYISKAAAEVAE